MRDRLPLVAGLLLLIVVLLSMSVFVVDQRSYALVFQLGEIKYPIDKPGLKFKIPLIQNVRYFDKRIMTFDTAEPALFPTSEKKNVLVDLFVKWRVVNPEKYYKVFGGNEAQVRNRLNQAVTAGLREEIGRRTVHEVVSGERSSIMSNMSKKASAEMLENGIEIVDVRLKRVDLPTEVSDSVYRRMEAERKSEASRLRAQGAAFAEKIKADADRDREVQVAQAYSEAQKVKGEGDATAAAIYAAAFSQNPEFYRFYRSLDAYKNSFRNKNDVLVIDPSSDFFKYMKSSSGSRESK